MTWREDALCSGSNIDFCSDLRIEINRAKEVCVRCPVIEQCKDFARKNREPWGVWGGESKLERFDIVRKNTRTNIDPNKLQEDFKTMTLTAVAVKYKTTNAIIYRHVKQYPWVREQKAK